MTHGPLSGLLVMTPTLRSLAYLTEVALDALVEAGARKIRTNGNSCVAMHRCQIAGKAAEVLCADPSLTNVLWLDGDMLAKVETVYQLTMLTNLVAEARPLPPELELDVDQEHVEEEARLWKRRNAPAISGAYVRRNDPAKYALRETFPALPPLTVTQTQLDGSIEIRQLKAIVSGMGCLCQTREAFLTHIAEAPIMGENHPDCFPAICGSGPGPSVDGTLSWGSEDWVYTSWEWQRGRGVYLAQHLPFGHIGEVVFWPQDDTKLES